jgi:hypothetical protein
MDSNKVRLSQSDLDRNILVGCVLSLLLLLSSVSVSSVLNHDAIAAVDLDTSGNGRAAAFDGEESIATDDDSFCSIIEDIAGGKFTSLFEGIVGECDNNSQTSKQFLVEYSYSKNPVKIGEKTHLTLTVKDKETGNPISDAFVTLAVDHAPSSIRDNIIASTAFSAAAAGIPSSSSQDVAVVEDKITQTMYTDNNGQAIFTVQLGPKSDVGIYDTEIEIAKDNYQSNFQQPHLRVT